MITLLNNILVHQGDSYPIPVRLVQDGVALTADMLEDLEICVGTVIKRTMRTGGIWHISDSDCFCFIPTQVETLSMQPGRYSVGVRVKYKDTPPSVNIETIGTMTIVASSFKEEI